MVRSPCVTARPALVPDWPMTGILRGRRRWAAKSPHGLDRAQI
jgi:hypothetical protein